MTGSFKAKAIRGLLWSSLEQGGRQGIHIAVTIVLARLLLPEQFGLIGMLAVFLGVAQSFVESGFTAALIQKNNATHVDECSIFYFNILVGVLAAGLLCFIAPWIAAFYDQPLLTPLTRALSLRLIVDAFGTVQLGLLTKRLDFKTQLKVSVIATILSGIIGIAMALRGFGVWSLVAQSLTMSVLQTILLWLFNTWRPRLVFSFTALGEMFGFGARLLASGLLNRVFENLHVVIIGRLFTPVDVGLYASASKLQQIPTQNLAGTVSRVTFPAFSTIQDDPIRLKRCMRKAVATLAFVNFPLMIGLAVVARPLVLVLLTEKWLAAVPYIQLLCVVGLLYPLHAINLNVLKAKGRSDLFFRLEVLKRILVVISIAVCYRWGIRAMIGGQIVVSLVGYYLNSYYTGRLIGYPMTAQVFDFLPYLIISLVMGAGVYLVQHLPLASDAVVLALEVVLGVCLYVGLSCVCGVSACLEVMEVLREALKPHVLFFARR